jgi:hypothetical protein
MNSPNTNRSIDGFIAVGQGGDQPRTHASRKDSIPVRAYTRKRSNGVSRRAKKVPQVKEIRYVRTTKSGIALTVLITLLVGIGIGAVATWKLASWHYDQTQQTTVTKSTADF